MEQTAPPLQASSEMPKDAATLRAEYAALENKRSAEGHALRAQIKDADERELAALPDGSKIVEKTRTVTLPRRGGGTKAQRAWAEMADEVRKTIPTEEGWYICGMQGHEGQPPPSHGKAHGGINFPVHCQDEKPTVKNDSIEYNQRRNGQRQYLDEDMLDTFREAAGTKIVRVRSQQAGRYAFVSAKSPDGRRRLKGDKLLECFLYITPCEEPEELDLSDPGVSAEEHAEPLFPAFKEA